MSAEVGPLQVPCQSAEDPREHVIYVITAHGAVRHEPMAWRMTRGEADAFANALELQRIAALGQLVNGERQQGYAVDGPFWWAIGFTVSAVSDCPPCDPPSGPLRQQDPVLSAEGQATVDRIYAEYGGTRVYP